MKSPLSVQLAHLLQAHSLNSDYLHLNEHNICTSNLVQNCEVALITFTREVLRHGGQSVSAMMMLWQR